MSSVIGMDVIVYCRYLFSVPVRGYITGVSSRDGAYEVYFYRDNPGSANVTKHDGTFFLPEQCRVISPTCGRPMLGLATIRELLDEIMARLAAH